MHATTVYTSRDFPPPFTRSGVHGLATRVASRQTHVYAFPRFANNSSYMLPRTTFRRRRRCCCCCYRGVRTATPHDMIYPILVTLQGCLQVCLHPGDSAAVAPFLNPIDSMAFLAVLAPRKHALLVKSPAVGCGSPPPKSLPTTHALVVELWLLLNRRNTCLLYTSPSPRDGLLSRMPSSA